jgi:hypothetical protein
MINLKIRAKLKYIHSFTYQTASTRQLVELANLTKDGTDAFRTEIFELLREEKKQELKGFSSSLDDYLTFYNQVMDQTLCFEQLTDSRSFTMQKCDQELVLKRGLQTAIYKFIDLSKNITSTISEINEAVDMDGDRIRMIGSLVLLRGHQHEFEPGNRAADGPVHSRHRFDGRGEAVGRVPAADRCLRGVGRGLLRLVPSVLREVEDEDLADPRHDEHAALYHRHQQRLSVQRSHQMDRSIKITRY